MAYLARKPCGCVPFVTVDNPDHGRQTAREIAQAIRPRHDRRTGVSPGRSGGVRALPRASTSRRCATGYPMTWRRFVNRNDLTGDYDSGSAHARIAGDLRRLEADQRDPVHLAGYAKRAGITPEQAPMVLTALFESTATDDLTDDEYQELYEALPWVQRIRRMEREGEL